MESTNAKEIEFQVCMKFLFERFPVAQVRKEPGRSLDVVPFFNPPPPEKMGSGGVFGGRGGEK
jgi:hypothetical protein